jgi:aubergine-like protein
LLSNYFPITSYTNWCLYQYRVDFNPEEDRIGTKRGLLAQHRERLGGYLFDGTMLFSGTRFDPEVSFYVLYVCTLNKYAII